MAEQQPENRCIGAHLGSKGPMASGEQRIETGRGGLWKGVRRIIAIFGIVAISGFIGGFLVFADQVSTAVPPATPRADAIVALTGGPRRITDAVNLLASGSAGKLLISGVNQQTTVDHLQRVVPDRAAYFQCCIDIGYTARNTKGNATESRDWARSNGFRSLIVVTSAYHIPRSMAELERVMPDVDLIAYPVQNPDISLDDWTGDFGIFRMLLTEYVKYLVARLG